MPSKEGDPTTKQEPLTRSPEIHISSMDRKRDRHSSSFSSRLASAAGAYRQSYSLLDYADDSHLILLILICSFVGRRGQAHNAGWNAFAHSFIVPGDPNHIFDVHAVSLFPSFTSLSAFIVPCRACLWFLRNLGSVPLSEGYLWVLGFLML